MAIILDVDGTLLDTQEKKTEAYEEIIKRINEHFPNKNIDMNLFWSIVRIQFELFSDFRKNDLEIRLRMIKAFRDFNSMKFNELLPHLVEIYWEKLLEGKEYPKAREFIEKIANNKIEYYLFSDCSIEEMEFKIKLFSNSFFPKFPTIFISDHRKSSNSNIICLGRNKTPETFDFLKKEYQTKIMVGDSELFDIIPAKKAGLVTFHVRNGEFGNIAEKIIEVLK